MTSFDWTCPYCNKGATITEHSMQQTIAHLTLRHSESARTLTVLFVVCPNSKCNRFTLSVSLFETDIAPVGGGRRLGDLLQTWNLIPGSRAETFPDYIPREILADYHEACLTREISPKASSTFARRCLQQIVRDFWDVTPGTLNDEINQIEKRVDATSWAAIKAVREVGKVGAHWDEPVHVIIEAEPKEADLLISLIETLLQDWYVARAEKEARLRGIIQLSQDTDGEQPVGGGIASLEEQVQS
ncbi:MAG: DUF4145 domain-containing protein [Candidatus Zixiibacteriota bacterium]|nr:MAG: DUF4145 domain-containing protein [candidate division Zixibacteria bacterium]